MQKMSTPVQQSSTILGRSLLEWFCNFEDYCCFLSAGTVLLPEIWRYENVRIRQSHAELDYPGLSLLDRKARLLDDLWPQLWAMIPQLSYLLARIPPLKSLQGLERSYQAEQLQSDLITFHEKFEAFTT